MIPPEISHDENSKLSSFSSIKIFKDGELLAEGDEFTIELKHKILKIKNGDLMEIESKK